MKLIRLDLDWTAIISNSTTSVFIPSGAWRACAGMAKARAAGEMRGLTGLITAQPTLEFANYENTPITTKLLGTSMTANNFYPPTAGQTDISTESAQYLLVRPGFTVALSTGSTTAWARVGGMIEIVLQ